MRFMVIFPITDSDIRAEFEQEIPRVIGSGRRTNTRKSLVEFYKCRIKELECGRLFFIPRKPYNNVPVGTINENLIR